MNVRVRDLLAVVETVGPYMSEEQIGEEIERLFRIAGGNVHEMPFDVERSRDERELGARREPA